MGWSDSQPPERNDGIQNAGSVRKGLDSCLKNCFFFVFSGLSCSFVSCARKWLPYLWYVQVAVYIVLVLPWPLAYAWPAGRCLFRKSANSTTEGQPTCVFLVHILYKERTTAPSKVAGPPAVTQSKYGGSAFHCRGETTKTPTAGYAIRSRHVTTQQHSGKGRCARPGFETGAFQVHLKLSLNEKQCARTNRIFGRFVQRLFALRWCFAPKSLSW